jgi:hypothetical protein
MNDDNKNHTSSSCYYYNWGGDSDKGYPSYPREYGARCEFHKEFFSEKDGIIIPHCSSCSESN